MELIKLEIEQLRYQIDLLDTIFDEIFDECTKEVSFCASVSRKLKISIKEYYESILHKLGYCKGKEE